MTPSARKARPPGIAVGSNAGEDRPTQRRDRSEYRQAVLMTRVLRAQFFTTTRTANCRRLALRRRVRRPVQIEAPSP